VIHARGLTRTFSTKNGPVEAVRGVDIDVAPGEIVGLLGPNGAGKTTTMRMLSTLLEPTSGTATIAAHDVRTDPVGVRRSIGYVAQGNSALAEALVGEELILQARLFGVPADEARRRAGILLTRLDLPGVGSRPYGSLSGGQRRRVDIASGLIHQPRLVVLDEPSTGLDPQSRANLWDHIHGLRDSGTTVLLTTHYMDEADALADRVLVMDHGTIIAEGAPATLKADVGGDVVTFEVAEPQQASHAVTIAAKAVAVTDSHVDVDRVSLTTSDGNKAIVPILRELDRAGISPTSVMVKRPSLDDVFLALTGRSLRDADEPHNTGDHAPAGMSQ
jgi:ABC-2 type transport system ATP-binding protein